MIHVRSYDIHNNIYNILGTMHGTGNQAALVFPGLRYIYAEQARYFSVEVTIGTIPSRCLWWYECFNYSLGIQPHRQRMSSFQMDGILMCKCNF